MGPQFSPDGRRIAFCSVRSGDAIEVWVAGSDGSNPVRLTRGPGAWQCSPAWSPDGRRIAFDSQAEDGSWHVWTIDAEGGTPQPITKEVGDQFRPTWSNDGAWIYFNWVHRKDSDIWRTRGAGQPPERVTFDGGIGEVRESADGTGVFYKRHTIGPLRFQARSGRASHEVVPCVAGHRFSVGRHGIYYVPCTYDRVLRDIPVHVINPATGEDRQYATLKNLPFPATWPTAGGFAVSPDGRTIVYGTYVSRGADLMLIDNFR
jgi:Tol biopolymer transport system component